MESQLVNPDLIRNGGFPNGSQTSPVMASNRS